MGDPPAYLEISQQYVRALGVEPDIADNLSDIIPDFAEDPRR